jgi:hypothetical protein
MLVKFELVMERAVVDDKFFDRIVLQWVSKLDQAELLEISRRWLSSRYFLTSRMVGLARVSASSLTIEPLDGCIPNFRI